MVPRQGLNATAGPAAVIGLKCLCYDEISLSRLFSFFFSFLFFSLFFLSFSFFFFLNVDNGHCAVAVGYTSWRNMQSLSHSFHLSLSLSASLCVCLSLSPTQNHTLTITPHRATKDMPTQASRTHTHTTHREYNGFLGL